MVVWLVVVFIVVMISMVVISTIMYWCKSHKRDGSGGQVLLGNWGGGHDRYFSGGEDRCGEVDGRGGRLCVLTSPCRAGVVTGDADGAAWECGVATLADVVIHVWNRKHVSKVK